MHGVHVIIQIYNIYHPIHRFTRIFCSHMLPVHYFVQTIPNYLEQGFAASNDALT